MNCLYALVLIVFAVSLLIAVAGRRHVTLNCFELLRRLHPHQLKGLSRYVDEDYGAPPDSNIWFATGGFGGLWKRWRNRVVLLRLCQLCYEHGGLSTGEMAAITHLAARLTQATLVAAALESVRAIVPQPADRTVLLAFRIYADIADSTHAYFAIERAPLCARKLAALL